MDKCRALRRLIAERGVELVPSAYDCISARILQEAGFRAIAVSGAGIAAAFAGFPDLGLISFGEVIQVVRNIARIVDVPVLADADNGYGNALNVVRTVREFEEAGVAGIHIEDQVLPKRCGYMTGKQVISADEFVMKIRAAAEARRNPDFVIVARTDAIAVHGIDDAIERANRALEAGADVAFVEAPVDLERVRRIGAEVRGPRMYNLATGSASPSLTAAQLAEYGFHLALVPAAAMWPAIHHMREAARAVRLAGSDEPLRYTGLSPQRLFELMGLADWLALADRYRHDA